MTTQSHHHLFDQSQEVSALEARYRANRIAFGPMMFQAVHVARSSGVLKHLLQSPTGRSVIQIAQAAGISQYAASVLLEACLASGVVRMSDGLYSLTKTGQMIERDEMTRINMDFVHDVCYLGMHRLDESLQKGEPSGLKVFGDWPTIYEGLSSLPPRVRDSWFRYDHFHSEHAFAQALDIVFADPPSKLLDIGGNTGRWAFRCLQHDANVHITIADLPQQLEMARANLGRDGLHYRVTCYPINLLDETQHLPGNHQVLWMSQFLVCFTPEQIVSILRRAAAAMSPTDRLYILDMFWDQQQYEVAAYCMIAASLYFTCMANGNSKVYALEEFVSCLRQANLEIVTSHPNLGFGHTLLECRRADGGQ